MFEGIENVVTETELVEACVYDIHDKKDDAFIQHETLCFEYMEHVGVLAFQKWYKLSKHIQRRNVCCLSLDEMKSIVGLTSAAKLSDWLQQMVSVGMLIVAYPEGTKNQRRVVYFNPWLVWKGSYRVRGRYRYLWNKMKGIDR